MSLSTTKLQLLDRARAGSTDALGQLLQLYENYLRVLVLAQFEARLRARVSPSDVLQETFCEAHRDFASFRGGTLPEFVAWIRQILVHNLKRCADRHVYAARRDVRREVNVEDLAARLDQSTARLDAMIADGATSPSLRVERQQQQLQIANLVANLPPDYRDVIVMRHFQSMSFDDIAGVMDRSAGAVRMLWLRAIKQLQAELKR